MDVLPRSEWSPLHYDAVARLVIDPACNGGTVSDLTPEQVIAAWPQTAPAWAVFDGPACVFCIGLNPFEWNPELTRLRGILHFARAPSMPLLMAYRMAASFLDAMKGVEVMTFTDRPGLVRLAARLGLMPLDVQDGYTLLGR